MKTKKISLHKIDGFAKWYTTGYVLKQVEINGFKTTISNMLKDGEQLLYHYTIKNKLGKYIDIDIRDIDAFPDIHYNELIQHGLNILQKHIQENPSSYNHLV